MKKELLSITDENSILITVEFLESGRRLSSGDVTIQRYEMDLIVNKNLTCEQLLDSISKGLENTLWNLGIPPESREFEEVLNLTYSDAELVLDHNPFSFGNVKKVFHERARRALEVHSDELDEELCLSQNDEQPEAQEPLEKQKKSCVICWKVFHECLHAYKYNYNGLADRHRILEGYDRELMRTDYPKSHPVIGRGSFNLNSVDRDEVFSISHRPQCWLFCERDSYRTLKELGFITTTRLVFDPILWHHSAPLFDERESAPVITPAFQGKTPEYNISDRTLKQLDDEPINVIEPTPPPQRQQQNIISLVLPPLLTTGAMVGIRMVTTTGGNAASMGLMAGAMGLVSLIVGLVNRGIQGVEHKKNTNEWRRQYQDYIDRLLNDIQDRQHKDVRLLQKLYPPALALESQAGARKDTLVEKILTVNGDIYSRRPGHPDFLSVRIGVSAENSHLVPSVFEISGAKKEAIFASLRYKNILHNGIPFRVLMDGELDLLSPSDGSEGYLIDLPNDISSHYRYLSNAPVLVNLDDCGALGIVYGDRKVDCHPFLSNLILDLCFYHAPEDVQCVMFCEETDDWHTQQSIIRRYKHLPHFRELLGDLSAFVFSESDAHKVFNKLTEILAERRNTSTDARFPHIVVIFHSEYSLKRHPFSQMLPEYAKDGTVKTPGISFVFCTEYTEQLPKYCGRVIYTIGENEHLLLPHTLQIPSVEKDRNRRIVAQPVDNELNVPFRREHYSYIPDRLIRKDVRLGEKESDDDYHRAFKTLSALRYARIAQGADMPNSVSLFELLRSYVGINDNSGSADTENEDTASAGVDDLQSRQNFLKPAPADLTDENFLEATTETAIPTSTSDDETAPVQNDGFVDGEVRTSVEVSAGEIENAEPASVNVMDTHDEYSATKEKLSREIKEYILSEWGLAPDTRTGKIPGKPKRNVIKSLAVPIGMNTQGVVELDLHEKGDGPHMLVAGTTGSGKTESILTYLINLCALYTPEQVTLLLMDMKGEDFVKRIGNLPHVVGTVTDVDGDKTGTNTAYMLKRFLLSMNAEVKRRKLMLSKMGVNNISSYIEARENLDKHMRIHHIPADRKDELKKMEPMPHLFLVIDEFTELMQFTAENSGVDFKTAITSLARVGRSLGFHIILISQNIESAITPDIRVNSRARLCLKVATREASKEMIGSDLAASPLMPGNGRAYLLVGTGSRFEYFQSGFSGADILGEPDEPILITQASTTGEYRVFFSSEKQDAIEKERREIIEASRLVEEEDDVPAHLPSLGDAELGTDIVSLGMDENTSRQEECTITPPTEETESTAEQISPATPTVTVRAKEKQSGIRQIQFLCDVIKKDIWNAGCCNTIAAPHIVFQPPLPTKCWYSYSWENGMGVYKHNDDTEGTEETVE